MKTTNKFLLVISVIVLINIIFQSIYFKINNKSEILNSIISFIGNFNFLTMIISPIILMVYSIIIAFLKEKYSIYLLIINAITCILFFVL